MYVLGTKRSMSDLTLLTKKYFDRYYVKPTIKNRNLVVNEITQKFKQDLAELTKQHRIQYDITNEVKTRISSEIVLLLSSSNLEHNLKGTKLTEALVNELIPRIKKAEDILVEISTSSHCFDHILDQVNNEISDLKSLDSLKILIIFWLCLISVGLFYLIFLRIY